jgi:protein O-GlcNAc transferase
MHADDMQFENIIVPLAGASNPIWQGDWITHPCRSSSLLSVFANRVLDYYGFLDQPRDHEEREIVITYIDRKSSRRLTNHTEYLDSIREKYPHIAVQSIDFASIPFHEQLAVIRGTDILLGVHGAGLTHGMFLPENSVMVEILPPVSITRGFGIWRACWVTHTTVHMPTRTTRAAIGMTMMLRFQWDGSWI